MFSYKSLAGLFMTLSLAAANIDTPSGADMCESQGEGSCQFATFDITDNTGGICSTALTRQAVIYDHACNQIGWSSDFFNEGDSIDSQLPYTVSIINEDGGQTADCRMKYTISYSDGTYGYGMPSNGAWNSCDAESGKACSWYRTAFPCPGF
ncbi:hypothetical protein N7456_005466 [Penicillium angulare]|uniref:Uncharacterized protein n=1 Tax=Penicillium angulare TaxID=116970 RepID=A0A9W9FYE2_9EURO|nr:hypothetical protein N7456_005466 [Penicillium angulare]